MTRQTAPYLFVVEGTVSTSAWTITRYFSSDTEALEACGRFAEEFADFRGFMALACWRTGATIDDAVLIGKAKLPEPKAIVTAASSAPTRNAR
jgi:hypothetical protein